MYVVVNSDRCFYTGNRFEQNGHSPFLWTPYLKQAKRYQKHGWAQQVANQWGGRVQEVDPVPFPPPERVSPS